MVRHSTNTASFFSVLIAALIFSLSLAGVAAAQGNTSLGTGALQNNTTGSFNTASGVNALFSNTTGNYNIASGFSALFSNTTGTSTPPADPMRSFTTPRATPTPPADTRRWTQTPQQQTRESEAAISTLKVQTAKLKEKDGQIETLLSRLEALTRIVLASGHLSNSELVNAFLPALRP